MEKKIRKMEKLMWWKMVRVLFDIALGFMFVEAAFDSNLGGGWRFLFGGFGLYTLIDSIRSIKMLVEARKIFKEIKLHLSVEEWKKKQREGFRLH